MRKSLFILLSMIGIIGCKTPDAVIEYGPRWVDYEEWGKIDIGMEKKSVLSVLGEPYMTSEGQSIGTQKQVTYIFKFRAKHYELKRMFKKEALWDPAKKPIVLTDMEKKPEKYSTSNVWGRIFDVFLTFENDKLVSWRCPELKIYSDHVNDSLKVKLAP